MGWTIGAAVILVILTGVTFAFLNGITEPEESGPQISGGVQVASIDQPDPPGGGGLRVAVNGQQYLWRYDYGSKNDLFSYYEMVVPTDTTVTLDITSSDVQHSWWIPKLGGKADAVPGHRNETWFKISKPGVYSGQCAELCGVQPRRHAGHRTRRPAGRVRSLGQAPAGRDQGRPRRAGRNATRARSRSGV